MTNLIVSLAFLALALLGVVMRKTYYSLPIKELKRRAAKRDEQAKKLYGAVAYERSLRALLWLYIGFTSAVSLILLCRSLEVWLSLLIVAPLLWLTFSFIPATKVTKFGMNVTLFFTPAVVWILSYTHPSLSNTTEKIENHFVKHGHTKLFEKDDLIDLIAKQKRQKDSRFTQEELDIAKRALEFTDQKVSEILIPSSECKRIKAGDHIGPVLIDEIYKSRQKYVLVQEDGKGPFLGILDADKLGIGSEGYVRNIMSPTIYYIHEDDSLSDALKAFFVTNFPAFVVTNDHAEFVGIATVEEILKKLMGHIPGDEFSEYSDISAVANRHNPNESIKSENLEEESEEVKDS